MEVESALVAHPRVAEAAVVGRPHDIKGESIFAYVVCRGTRPVGEEAAKLVTELREWVGKQLGAIAKPDDIRIAEVLPKTRSGRSCAGCYGRSPRRGDHAGHLDA